MTSVSNNGFVPNPDPFFQNFSLPDAQELLPNPDPFLQNFSLPDAQGLLSNPDSFFQNLNLPDAQALASFDENLLSGLIGYADPNTASAMSGNFDKANQWAQEYQAVLSKGDGNAAVDRIIKGLKEGLLSKEEAIELAKQVQEQANAAGGGRINGGMREALKEALGTDTDYITKGKTRGQMGWDKFINGILALFGL